MHWSIVIVVLMSFPSASGGNIYVSRSLGKDTASCGESEATSCKSLAAGVAHAQPGFTISVDGTGTELDPYPCTSSSSRNILNIDTSLHFKSWKSISFIRCKDGGALFLNGTKKSPVFKVSFQGLVFVNSSIEGEDCSVQFENCSFVNASRSTAALSLLSKGDFSVSVVLRNLSCTNSLTSCVLIRANSLFVQVSDSEFAQNHINSQYLPGIFTITRPDRQSEPPVSNSSFHATFTRSLFQRNHSPFKGSLYIDFKSQNDSFCKNNQGKTAALLHLLLKTIPLVAFVVIDTGNFENNTGKGLGIVFGHKPVHLNISHSVFNGNIDSRPYPRASGAAVLINGFTNATLTIAASKFTNNSCSGSGGAIAVIGTASVEVQIQSSIFERNVASLSGSAILVGPSYLPDPPPEEVVQYAKVVIKGVQFRENALLTNPYTNIFRGGTVTFDVAQIVEVDIHNSSFVKNTAIKGSLTLYIVSGSDQHVAISSTIFNRNYPSTGHGLDNLTDINQVQGLVLASPQGQVHLTLLKVDILDHLTADPAMEFVYVMGQSVRASFSSLVLMNNTNGSINIIAQGGGESSSAISSIIVTDLRFLNNANFAWLMKLHQSMSTLVEFQNVRFIGSQNRQSTPLLQVEGTSGGETIVTLQNATFIDNFIFAPVIKVQFELDHPYVPCEHPEPDWLDQVNVNFQSIIFLKNYSPSSNLVELKNGKYSLCDCLFLDNYNSQRFSNLFLDQGSTTVSIQNTRFLQIGKPTDVHGFQFGRNILLNSNTYAPVSLNNVTLKWDIPGATTVLFMVSQSLKVVDQATTIECPLGSRLTQSDYSYYSSYVAKNCEIPKLMLTYFMYTCESCNPQTYTILPNATDCLPCPYGANCSHNLAARAGFWGYPVNSSDHSGKVAFVQCPPGYCCPHKNISCPYRNDTYKRTGCQGSREGILCGKCLDGYTETLFSTECRAERDCRDHWFWPVALFVSLGFALYLIKKPDLWSCLKGKIFWFKTNEDDESRAATNTRNGGYMKVLFYFYQMAYLLMFYDEAMLNFFELNVTVPVTGLFNFQISYKKPSSICPLAGLSVTSKTVLHTSQVFVVLMCIVIVYLAHAALNKMKKRSPCFAPAGPYLGALAEGLLLGYSTLAITIMKILHCVRLGSTYHSFYDGNVECYTHWWQILSIALVITFVFPFTLVVVWGTKLLTKGSISAVQFLFACILPLPLLLYWLKIRALGGTAESSRHTAEEQRGSLNQHRRRSSTADHDARYRVLAVVCGPYCRPSPEGHGEVIYWEGVLVLRRLILVLLVCIPELLPRMILMSVVCVLALGHHVWVKPFADWKVNLLETVSLTGLVIIVLKSFNQAAYLRSETQHSALEKNILYAFQWVEVALLGIAPLLFLIGAGIALISQLFYCVFICVKYLLCCARVVLQGWEKIE